MPRYNKDKIRTFFREIWSNPDNANRLRELQEERVRRMNIYHSDEKEHEERCVRLGVPIIEFVIS